MELAHTTQVSAHHPRDLRFGFRSTAAHEMDIGVVIAHLCGGFGLPVWFVSKSRGTTSLLSGASQLDVHRRDGIVLTSSMLAPVTNGNQVFDFLLKKISIPALITHHREDGCVATLARDVPQLARELSSAAPKGVKFYEGGKLGDNEYGARSHHGYQGIEEQVIDDIEACTQLGIVISSDLHMSTPSYATAELTWGLVMAAMLEIPQQMVSLRSGGSQIGCRLHGPW